MKNSIWAAVLTAVASACVAQTPGPAAAQELSADAKSKEAAEARAKRNAQQFENNARILTFYDRSGKRTGQIGERALYDDTALSPDGKRVAVIKTDLPNEKSDLWILEVATGKSTRITSNARTEFTFGVVWSPDSSRVAYATMRKAEEFMYMRAANGEGAEELLYQSPGAIMLLSDWSPDGRFLGFAKFDLGGGVMYMLPLENNPEHKPVEVYKTDLRVFGPRFSPDGRFLAYTEVDKANKGEIFVRPLDSAGGGPWQISQGSSSPPVWRRDGKELYYMARDQSLMVAEVSTSPAFTFAPPKVLFRQQAAVPDRFGSISADGEHFLTLPPPRGPQVQQLTIFDRTGTIVKKVGEPGLYGQPSFSPDSTHLLVMKNDRQAGQSDLWTIDIATGQSTRITNDTQNKANAMWSHDGRYIVWASFRNDYSGIYRKPSDGTGSEELLFRYTPGAGMGLSDISADGKTLVCDSGGVVLVVPLTGSDPLERKAIEYLREEFDDGVGRLSPDGRFMAFRSDEAKPERGEVYVRTFNAATGMPGEGKWRVSKDGVQAMLHWRADGKEIFFRGLDLDSNDLRVMSAEVTTDPTFRVVGEPKLLFKLPGPLGGNLGNISADGQRFVFAINVPAAKPAADTH